MKVLWITGTMLPEAASLMSGGGQFKTSGGWIVGAAEALGSDRNVELSIAIASTKVTEVKRLVGKTINYYIFPTPKRAELYSHKDKRTIGSLRKIATMVEPEIIHIHGTEHSLGLAYIKAVGKKNVVVSIQGLISVIADYYQTGISIKEHLMSMTLRDVISDTSITTEQRQFRKRGKNEITLLKQVEHVIGRTEFDKAHTWAINPYRKYHFCNETLRREFYEASWSYKECEKHSIFLSQANYPIKGLHLFLKALPLVLREYNDAKVYIAGPDITREKESVIRKLMIPGYGRLIKQLLSKYNIKNCVEFTGPLDAQGMVNRLVRANVFVSSSTIENSPNSLGEAQLVGTPCVASNVGGVPDFIKSAEYGLTYRCDDIVDLACKICEQFKAASVFDNTAMKDEARRRHDGKKNLQDLINIYKEIKSENA